MKNKSTSGKGFKVIFSNGDRMQVEQGFILDLSPLDGVFLYGPSERPVDLLNATGAMLMVLLQKNISIYPLVVAMAQNEEGRKVLADLVKFGCDALAQDVEELHLAIFPEGAWLDGTL